MPWAGDGLYGGERRYADLDGAPRSSLHQQVERVDHCSAQRLPLRFEPGICRVDHCVSARTAERGDRCLARPLGQAEGTTLAVDGRQQPLRVQSSWRHNQGR
jgi:hypothetical protein